MIAKGTKIRCLACKKQVYTAARDLMSGEGLVSGMFEGINGNANPKDGDVFKCPACDSAPGLFAGLSKVNK